MKKVIFCILILGVNSAFCMKWGKRLLKNESIRYYTEDPCGSAHRAVAQRCLAYLDERIDRVRGDERTYLKLIQFALQTKAGEAWQEYDNKPGITPAQDLIAFPEPDANPPIRNAMQDFKREILSRWTFCACCGPDDRASLEARKNALRHMLITGPEIFTNTIDVWAGGGPLRGLHNLQFLHYVNNIFVRIDPDTFRCEGMTIYQRIEDLRKQGKLNEDDYKAVQEWGYWEMGDYLKREGQKE